MQATDETGRRGLTMSSGGLSRARLGRMHDVMAGHVERGEAPGIVTLLSRRGEVHIDAIGTLAFGGSAPIRRDTIFRLASVSKPITAVAAMILVEECRLRLDEPVDGWLPELADRTVLRAIDSPLDDTVPANRPITPRDLLTFRMGFGLSIPLYMGGYPLQQAMNERGLSIGPMLRAASSPDEWIGALGSLPLIHQPGERWLYHTGSDVLGVLIARASGQPFETFLRERVFEPLGMGDTGFSVPSAKLDRLADCYQRNQQSGAFEHFDDPNDSRWSRPPRFESGGGGLVSTADDLFAFGQMMLNNGTYGNERILSRPTVEAMTTDQLTPEQRAGGSLILGDNRGWGFGLSVVIRRDGVASAPGRYGWDGGYGTSWQVDPTEGLIGILLTQVL
ncbi:MAG: serine hydrolase domain-containing protein, partial [Vicinamibacterales bacterium]